ncbi:hypothetical protein DB32_000948 [Sandaracinus amylolyticus]|uniref:Uncharacterized protein n=1 Tax=Sandaracinus amylolyticus TaxID=927083 RepID=A0A0F6SDP4_9BACT|nr:hypothetical protein DB32_000948 [Sandaracinus amylolyticus]
MSSISVSSFGARIVSPHVDRARASREDPHAVGAAIYDLAIA